MRKLVTTVLTGVSMLMVATTGFAQNGNSATDRGATPNGRPFRSLQAQVTSLQMQVSDLKTEVGTHIASLQGQIDMLAVQVAANTASIEELRQYNVLQDQRISTLGGTVLALEQAVAANAADLEALQLHDQLQDDWIAALEARWRGAEARLAQNAADIQRLVDADRALQQYVNALRADVNWLQGRIHVAEFAADNALNQVSDLRNQLTSVYGRLDDLQYHVNNKQNLIRGACPAGQAIRQIDYWGDVACEVGDRGGAQLTSNYNEWRYATYATGSYVYAEATCPSGYGPSGGGFNISHAMMVYYSVPTSNGHGVAAYNPYSWGAWVYAVTRCASSQ